MRILVTGGAGFLGSALVWGLNARGYDDIWIADFLGTSSKWRNLSPLRFSEYLEADRLRERLDRLPEFGLVLHMGACSATTEADATYLIDNNYEYTRELARWALPRKTRMVYASSAATYGDGSAGMQDSTAVLERLRPLNAYGFSKHLFDRMAYREGWLEQLVGLKYFNVFGPNEAHKGDMRSLVDKAFEQVTRTGRLGLFKSYRPDFADGQQRRDFLYVKDAVDMTLFLAFHPYARGLYNLGSGVASTWLELADALFAAMGRDPDIDFIEMPEELRGRYQYFTQADLSRLRGQGYTGQLTPLADAIGEYVKDYLMPDRRLGDESAGLERKTSLPEVFGQLDKSPRKE